MGRSHEDATAECIISDIRFSNTNTYKIGRWGAPEVRRADRSDIEQIETRKFEFATGRRSLCPRQIEAKAETKTLMLFRMHFGGQFSVKYCTLPKVDILF